MCSQQQHGYQQHHLGQQYHRQQPQQQHHVMYQDQRRQFGVQNPSAGGIFWPPQHHGVPQQHMYCPPQHGHVYQRGRQQDRYQNHLGQQQHRRQQPHYRQQQQQQQQQQQHHMAYQDQDQRMQNAAKAAAEAKAKETQKLSELNNKLEAAKRRARRSFTESRFEAAVVEYTDAVSSLKQLVFIMKLPEMEKRLAPLLCSRATAQIMIGRYRSAVTDCALALEVNKDFHEAYPRMGEALTLAGDIGQAVNVFHMGLSQDSRNRDCRHGLASIAEIRFRLENARREFDRGENFKAIICADQALASSPNLEEAQTLIVKVLMKMRNADDILRRSKLWASKLHMSNSLDGFTKDGLPPRACLCAMHASIREAYVKSLRNTGRIGAFEEVLDEAKATGVAWAVNMSRRRLQVMRKKDCADAAYAAKRYCTALELYTEALAIDVDDWTTKAILHGNRATVLRALGRNSRALQDCDEALRLKPMYPDVLLLRARVHKRLLHWEEATKDYEVYASIMGEYADITAERVECVVKIREEELEKENVKRQYRQQRYRHHFSGGSGGGFASGRGAGGGGAGDPTATPSSGLYAMLGVKSSATTSELKKAYLKLALEHHPDKNLGDSEAAGRFREINDAYVVLRDEKERAARRRATSNGT